MFVYRQLCTIFKIISKKDAIFSWKCFGSLKIVSTFATANERENGCKTSRNAQQRMARSSIG